MDLLPNTGFSCCKSYHRSFGLQSKPHFKGLLRNPSFHTIDITHATGVILSFYSPYVNKPRDYFVQGIGCPAERDFQPTSCFFTGFPPDESLVRRYRHLFFEITSCLRRIYLTKYFRHQDTKTRSLIIINIYCLCLGAFVAIFSGLSGFGL